MKEFLVEYRINIDAETPLEAAQKAQDYCLHPTFEGRVWTVTKEGGEEVSFLLKPDGKMLHE